MRLIASLVVAVLGAAACARTSASEEYFGTVSPPEGQQLRYVSGSEPESLDPQIGTGQPEARIYVGLYEGLTEFDPQTGKAIPALAERWTIGRDNTEFTFYLRQNARWSDGAPVTADDVVYTFRRGLSPALASRNAYMGYEILYAEAFNGGASFVQDASGRFVPDPANPALRMVVPSDPADRQRALASLRGRAGIRLVPVRGEDLGVTAVDRHTVRITTVRPVPFLPDLMAHQLFRPVPRQAVERFGDAWTQPRNIVVNGPFTLETWRPYDRIILVRNPHYWDAESVRLDRITFYPLEEATTMMNLYKAGEIDALYNHVPPAAWMDELQQLKDHMNEPEAGTEFYWVNTTRPPMDDVRVRKAFNLAVDKNALADYRRIVKPLGGLVPEGIFPGYANPQKPEFDRDRARALLAEAGYRDASGAYDPGRFPIGDVELFYNTSESNRQVAEFVQAQWRQNLGLLVPLRNMEFRTFIPARANLEYRGVARAGWAADYLDPYTFLDLLSTRGGNNGSGWFDPRYSELLRQANREGDPQRRYALLAEAEALMLEAQPIIPLYTPATNWMKKPYVKGMYPNPLTIHAWKHVWIEHDPSKWD